MGASPGAAAGAGAGSTSPALGAIAGTSLASFTSLIASLGFSAGVLLGLLVLGTPLPRRGRALDTGLKGDKLFRTEGGLVTLLVAKAVALPLAAGLANGEARLLALPGLKEGTLGACPGSLVAEVLPVETVGILVAEVLAAVSEGSLAPIGVVVLEEVLGIFPELLFASEAFLGTEGTLASDGNLGGVP